MSTSDVTIEALVPAIGITGLDPSNWPMMEGMRSIVIGTSAQYPTSVMVSPGVLAAHGGRLASKISSLVLEGLVRVISAGGRVLTAAEVAAVGSMGSISQHGRIAVSLSGNLDPISGTWAESYDDVAHAYSVERTAANAVHKAVLKIPLMPSRDASGSGIKPIGFILHYSVDTADIDDLDVEVFVTSSPLDGAAAVVSSLSTGQVYDSEHDDAAKRSDSTGAPEYHTMTIMFDTGLPTVAFMQPGDSIHAELTVDGSATGELVIRGWELVIEERLQ